MIVHDEYSQTKAILDIKHLDLSRKHEVKIKIYRSNKSLEQNNTYWQWVSDIANALGNFKEEQDFDLRWMHLPPVFRTVQGQVIETRKTISQLKIDEMRDFMDKVSMWAGSEGIYIRMPEDMHADT